MFACLLCPQPGSGPALPGRDGRGGDGSGSLPYVRIVCAGACVCCVCVCCVCACVRAYLEVRVRRMDGWVDVRMYVCMYECMYVGVCVCVCVYT